MLRTVLGTLVALLLLPGIATAGERHKPRVGHTVERVVVTGSAVGEQRHVDVHLWYPADRRRLHRYTRTVYTSGLHGRALLPELGDALSWTVKAEVAREGAPIARRGDRFPAIVFSHGAVNDPIDYAHTLELIAGAGFVVAAPSHVNNTQDDVRRTFVNARAGFELLECLDGRPTPCARPNLAFSMADRVSDVSAVLDALPGWLGDRVDTSRAGVLGHSRGTVTGLAAAGGSPTWPLVPEPRVAAVMGMAIGGLGVIGGVDLANVTVPTLLVAGSLDVTSPPSNSQFAIDGIASPYKELLVLEGVMHRSYDSTYCDQVQAAGAIAQANPRAILDRHTFDEIARDAPAGGALDFCDFEAFTDPVDITGLFGGIEITPDTVPGTGRDTDEVKRLVSKLAAVFFGTALRRSR